MQPDVSALLDQLQEQRFYGSLELKLEAGRVVLVRKTETIKPLSNDGANYRNNRGESDVFRKNTH